jgi:hypothetical protein
VAADLDARVRALLTADRDIRLAEVANLGTATDQLERIRATARGLDAARATSADL